MRVALWWRCALALAALSQAGSARAQAEACTNPTKEIHCDHPDVVAKANELQTPLRIYQFVRNEIEYDVYYGSKKGALGALWSRSGNDYDQASLLIALLRAIGVQARYAIGMVAIDQEQHKQWSGIRTPGGGTLLFQAQYCGLPASGSACTANPRRFIPLGSGVTMEHAWVEALLPAPYRGIDVGASGLRWIPLDPSWKQKRYPTEIVALDIGNEVTGNCAAPKICFEYTDYYSRFDPRLASEVWERQLQQSIAAIPALDGKTVADAIYHGPIVPDQGEVLPTSLPFIPKPANLSGNPPTAGPFNTTDLGSLGTTPARRFHLAIRMKHSNSAVHTFGDFPLVDLVGKRMTVVWEPDSASRPNVLKYGGYLGGAPSGHETLMDLCLQAGFTHASCPKVIPVLKIDDARYPIQVPAALGETNRWTLQLDRDLRPDASGVAEYQLTNGVHFAVSLDANQDGPAQMQARIDALLSLRDRFAQQGSPLLDEGEGDGNGNGVPGEMVVDQSGNGEPDAQITPCYDPTYSASDVIEKCDIAIPARFRFDPGVPVEAEPDEVLGELLSLIAARYMQRDREESERVLAMDGYVGAFTPFVGIARAGVHFTYLFNQPVGVHPASPVIDIRGVSYSMLRVDGSVTIEEARREGRLLMHVGSSLEHQVWEEVIGSEFVSTVKGIQLVRERYPEQLVQSFTSSGGVDAALNFEFDRISDATRTRIKQILDDPAYSSKLVLTPKAAVSAEGDRVEVYYSEQQSGGSFVTFQMAITSGSETLGGAKQVQQPGYDPRSSWRSPTLEQISESLLLSQIDGYGDDWSADALAPRDPVFLSSSLVGDPVSMISGNLHHTERDLAIRSDGPSFDLTRSYNSRVEEAGALGFGWTHSYDLRVQPVHDEQEFVYLPSSQANFLDQDRVQGVRSDTLGTWNLANGGAVETLTWAALPTVFRSGIDSIEAVSLELVFGPENAEFTVEFPSTGQAAVTVKASGSVDFETIDLTIPASGLPPDLSQPITVELGRTNKLFDGSDRLYYGRLRIRYHGPGVERVELEQETRSGWSEPTQLVDEDPSTCTLPTTDNCPGCSIQFEPQSPARAFGYEVLASVARENSEADLQSRIWRGTAASGEAFLSGPNQNDGTKVRFMTLAETLNPYGFVVTFDSDFFSSAGAADVKLCDLRYRILVMPRQRDVVLEDGSRARFTDGGTPVEPQWEAAPGIRARLVEDASGFELRHLDGRVLRFDHAAPDNAYLLTAITDPQGRSLALSYDPSTHRLQSVADDAPMLLPSGVTLTPTLSFTYDGGYLDRVTDWSDPPRVWDYDVTAEGHLLEARNPDQVYREVPGTRYEYGLASQDESPDLAHNLTRITYPKNGGQHIVRFEYYLSDRVASHTDSLGNRQTFLFNIPRLESQTTDPRGFTTIYRHDRESNLVQRVDPDGATWDWEHDDDRNVTKEIDPLGRAREFLDYDPACAKPRQIQDRDGETILMTYDVTNATPPEPITCREVTVTDKRGHVRTTSRVNGLPTSVAATLDGQTAPGTVLVANVYDSAVNPRRLDRVIGTIKPDQVKRSLTALFYPRNPRDVERIEHWEDSDGDGFGEPAAGEKLLGTRRLEYDDVGRIQVERVDRIDDPDGLTPPVELSTVYDYDRLSRPSRVTRPDGAALVSDYDENGNLEFLYLEETPPHRPAPPASATGLRLRRGRPAADRHGRRGRCHPIRVRRGWQPGRHDRPRG